MEKLHVVFASDNGYVQHLAVSLVSLFENTNYSNFVHIHIIDGGIQQSYKSFLVLLCEKYKASCSFLPADEGKLKNIVVNGHITAASYYRLLIPYLLDEKVTKAIYLDCDLLIRDDIYHLWSHDISEYAVGAIKFNEYNFHENIGIPSDASYFNAGVLVMNLKKWRSEQIGDKIFNFITNYPERLLSHDQDALNAILYDDFLMIDYTWNLRTQVLDLDFKKAGFASAKRFEEVKANPSIVHFTTYSKPWHYANSHVFKEEYFKYLELSQFPYTKYPEMKVIQNREFVLFGTGKGAEKTTELIKEYPVEIAYYVDNNAEKWGKKFLGKPIKSADELLEQNNVLVVIASQFEEEISEQLVRMGLKENNQFVRNYKKLPNVRE